MEKVQILMSTYNGEKFVGQQIESLLQQNYPNIEILIRDDGSKDQTVSILENYKKKSPNIKMMIGENIGVISSFFNLVKVSDNGAGYFAFCDQDDYWKPEKVSRAISLLEKEDANIPLIYFSRLDLVDEHLHFIKHSQIPPSGASFQNALIQNIATGCTIVFNQSMKKLFLSKIPDIKKVTMHDAWFYLLGTAFGKVIYDDQSYLSYRQHSSNALGMADNKFKSAIVRYKTFKKKGHEKPFSSQTEEFYRLFKNELSGEQKSLAEDFLYKRDSFIQRISYISNTPLYRQNKRDTFIFKLLFAFNSY